MSSTDCISCIFLLYQLINFDLHANTTDLGPHILEQISKIQQQTTLDVDGSESDQIFLCHL